MNQKRAFVISTLSIGIIGLALAIIGIFYDAKNFPIFFVVGASLMVSAETWFLLRSLMLNKDKSTVKIKNNNRTEF